MSSEVKTPATLQIPIRMTAQAPYPDELAPRNTGSQ
jgi:hypothetical protein